MTLLTHNTPYVFLMCHGIARAGVSVLSVDFRNASHHPFPTGVDDCLAALLWARKSAKELGTNGTVVTFGESGGGNLALASFIRGQQKGFKDFTDGILSDSPFIAKVYPSLPSHKEFDGYWLPTDLLKATALNYTTSEADSNDPAAWPILATDEQLLSFPPTHLVAGECDPIRSDAETFFARLRKLRVPNCSMTMNYGEIHCQSWCGMNHKVALESACHRAAGFVKVINSKVAGTSDWY